MITKILICLDVLTFISCLVIHFNGGVSDWYLLPIWIGIAFFAHMTVLIQEANHD